MTYIFDFDGTLVDSMPVFSQTMLRIIEENHLDCPDDVVKIITPLGYKGTAEYLIQLGLKMGVSEFVEHAVALARYEYAHHIPAKKYVKEKLVELKNNGHSLNVLTASPHSVLDACLKRVGLFDLFDNVWSCDDFRCSKAETKIYCDVANRLNQKIENCCFVDDNVNAVSTAKKAGMIAVGVYDDSSSEFVEEMKKVSDRYIFDFSEL